MYTHLRHPKPSQNAPGRYNKTIRVTDQRVMSIACGRSLTTTADERHSSVKALGTICMPNWRRELANLLDVIDAGSLSVAKRREIDLARIALQDDAKKPDGIYRHLVTIRDLANRKPGLGKKTVS